MATSSTVANGDLATAAQYNDLRTDVLSTHVHDGTDGNATLKLSTIDRSTGNSLMIALASSFPSADGTAVHIWDGTAGGVTANANSRLVIESSDTGDTLVSILGPNAASKGMVFGEPAGNARGSIIYFGSTDTPADTLAFATVSTQRLRYSAGAFAFQEATTISTTAGNLTLSPNSGIIDLPTTTVFGVATNIEFGIAVTVHQTVSNSGGNVKYQVINTSNTASSSAFFQAQVAGSSAADPYVILNINGGQNWFIGLDNSASDQFTIGESVPGTTDALRITASGRAITFDDSTGADFDYVCESCGRAQLSAFTCCGPVSWHDDVLALRNMRLSEKGFNHMLMLGVIELDGPDDSDPGWVGINFQKAMHMTWSGMWQLREMIDTLDRRLESVGA